MSRIGKLPIEIPNGVEVSMGDEIAVKGPKGNLSLNVHPSVVAELQEKEIIITPKDESLRTKALWGLMRSLIANMIEGVSNGYEKKLIIEGVGFRAVAEGQSLVLNVGFSHPIKLTPPEGVSFEVAGNVITVSGIDKQQVGAFAAKIRKTKPVEPYKGKGIKYEDEVVRRKLGKKAIGAEGA